MKHDSFNHGFTHEIVVNFQVWMYAHSNLAPGNMDVKTTTTCKVGKVFNIE